MTLTVEALRARVIAHTLFAPTTLRGAIERLRFVQADPIRAPARAQDLILRLRVQGYRAGDLERQYPELNIEEGLFYAYGFMPRALWHLRHPFKPARSTRVEQKVLDVLRARGALHPAVLAAEVGKKTAINAWGGRSKVTKLALERLHRFGLVRVARRDQGIRVYEPSPPLGEREAPERIFRTLALTLVHVLGPLPERSFRAVLAPWARPLRAGVARACVQRLFAEGELVREVVAQQPYVLAGEASAEAERAEDEGDAPRLRLLAPFDPLVWDRRRFEHLWGWAYRFEAYTPIAKRVRGYYALPLLYRDRVIGWGNLSVTGGALDADFGFVDRRPRERAFTPALDAELDRIRRFLALA